MPDVPAVLTKYPNSNFVHVLVPKPDFEKILTAKEGKIIFPLAEGLPDAPVVSRFLAKVALEAMALRLVEFPEGIAYICEEIQLDCVRNHARMGYIKSWPIHIRTIYNQDGKTFSISGVAEQTVHEFDFLVTDQSEWFFVLAIFGVEFAINLGGPDISGYHRWLKQTSGLSPLYTGRNGSIASMPK